MAIFTSFISGSGGVHGAQTLTGSFGLAGKFVPAMGYPTILSASMEIAGPRIAIGTGSSGIALAIGNDLGLSDTTSQAQVTISPMAGPGGTAAGLYWGFDSDNYAVAFQSRSTGAFEIETKRGGSSYKGIRIVDGTMSVGHDSPASGLTIPSDVWFNGTTKNVLIGDGADPPASNAKLFLGNTDTYVGHSTALGGHLILQSTSSIIMMKDGTEGAGESLTTWLKCRNAQNDVRIEAPGGMQVDAALYVTGVIEGKSGFLHEQSSSPALLDLRRIDSAITTNEPLAMISMQGSEDSGATIVGGSRIESVARSAWTPGGDCPSQLYFYNTTGSATQPTWGMILDNNNDLNVRGDLLLHGMDIKDSTAAVHITLEGSGDVKVANNLKLGNNQILASDGGVSITVDAADNVTVGNSLQVGGNTIKNSAGNTEITLNNLGVTAAGYLKTDTNSIRGSAGEVIQFRNDDDNGAGTVAEFQSNIRVVGNKIQNSSAQDMLQFASNSTSVFHLAAITGSVGGTGDQRLVWVGNNQSFVAGVDSTDNKFKLAMGSALTTGHVLVVDAGASTGSVLFTTPVTSSGGGHRFNTGGLRFDGFDKRTLYGTKERNILLVKGENEDVSIYRVEGPTDGDYGFTNVYSGSGSGNNNSLEWWSDAQNTGAHIKAMAIYQDGNVSPLAVLGRDSETADASAPANPSVIIAGRRESKVINFFIPSSLNTSTRLLSAGGNHTTSDYTFTDYDQGSGATNQYRLCDIMSSDGYIESITILGDTGCGPNNSASSTERFDLVVYRQSANTQTDLSSLSADHEWSFRYGYASGIMQSQAGKVKTVILGDSNSGAVGPANKSDTAFSAGDKLWFAFDPGSGTTTWKYEDASTSTDCIWQIKVNYVFDDRNLHT